MQRCAVRIVGMLHVLALLGVCGCSGSSEREEEPSDAGSVSDGSGDVSSTDVAVDVETQDAGDDTPSDADDTDADASGADVSTDPGSADVVADAPGDSNDDSGAVDVVDAGAVDAGVADVPGDTDSVADTTDVGVESGLGQDQLSNGMHNVAYLETVGWIHAFEDGASGTWRAVISTSDDGAVWTEAEQVVADDGLTAQQNVSLSTCGRLVGGETEEPWLVVSWTEVREGFAQLMAAEGPSPSALSPPFAVSSHTDSVRLRGRVVCNGDGSLHAAWTRQHSGDRWDETWYASKPYGGEWETPRAIFPGAHYSNDTDIDARGDYVWVVTSHDTFFSTTLMLHRSVDGGATWTTSDLLGYDATDAVAWLPSLAFAYPGPFGGNEYLYVVYMDRPGTGVPTSPAVMRSADLGETWSAPVRLSELALPDDVPHDRRRAPSLQPTSWNRPYVMWADAAQTTAGGAINDDVYFVGADDDGASWPTRLRDTAPHNDRPEVMVQNRAAFGFRTVSTVALQVVTTWIDDRDGVPTMQRRVETWED